MSDETSTIEGRVLLDSWTARHGHEHADRCPGCGDPTGTVGIIKLVYSFDVCWCGGGDYDHLVETLWHRVCLRPEPCPGFTPFHVRGARGRPAHDTEDCTLCGRLEASHT